MNITVTTKYDYERIIDFQIWHHLSAKFLWICMAIIVTFSSFVFFANLYLGTQDEGSVICFVAAIVFVVAYLFLIFVFPRFSIKKSYFYDQEEIMTFTEEGISYTSVCRGSNTSGTVAYPTIMRVIKTKKSYILYISSITAYLVDRKGVCEQVEEAEFDALLLRVLGKDKIKFKM